MQDSSTGDVQAIFYTYTACIYALYRDDAVASDAGGAFRTRTIEVCGCLGGRLPSRWFVAMCSRGCDNMLDVWSH